MEGHDETMPLPAPVGDDLIGRVLAEKYRILDRAGRGGMAKIYRAEQMPLGRIVAVKVLAAPPQQESREDAEFSQRFFLEASTLSKLTHPNTVTVFDYGYAPEENIYYMVMEFVEGRTLKQAIREDGAMPPHRALRIITEIARSLQEAHGLGIVHRDLKPANVMLVETVEGERVKVLDFGIAKVLQQAAQDITLDGQIVGSPKYMSPEHIRHGTVDGRSDLYSLGIVLYEMLTGQAPFSAGTTVQTMFAHVNEAVPPLAGRCQWDVPPRLESLVQSLLAKDPSGRPADVAAFRVELKLVMAEIADATTDSKAITEGLLVALEQKIADEGGSALTRFVRSSRPWLLALLLVAATAAVGVFGLGPLLQQEAPRPPDPKPVPVVVAPDPVPSQVPSTVPYHIVSQPLGAEVWEGTRLHGVTPVDVDLTRGAPARTFEVKLKGYQSALATQAWADPAPIVTVELKKRATAAAPRSDVQGGDMDIVIER